MSEINHSNFYFSPIYSPNSARLSVILVYQEKRNNVDQIGSGKLADEEVIMKVNLQFLL